ncbi:hypothetical protein ACF1GW_10275 [Streptomyces achromogenes]|uniref:hypothetical protein n=1 Tax=Streptomyces achromogenes TaxID=67255 RepID=UPI0036FE0816
MIAHLNEPSGAPYGPLADALGRVVSTVEVPAKDTVVAYWPGLDAYTLGDETSAWTAAQWAEHLEDPLLEHPFAADPAEIGWPSCTSTSGCTPTIAVCTVRSGLRSPTVSPGRPAWRTPGIGPAAGGSLSRRSPDAWT